MPQLNPAPWLFILVLSWLTVLIFKTKALHATPINTTNTHNILPHYTTPWNWPWT